MSRERSKADDPRGSVPVFGLPVRQPGSGFSLLNGVRILDLTTSIAGPYATLLLSDLGAEVIKIERLGVGDDSRNWGPPFLDGKSLWHASVNRNKRSIALDYGSGPGKDVLKALVGKCDALVTNQLPKVRAKLGTDYETLSRLNPSLIYVSVTGFGTDGGRSAWPCYDIIAEGYSGIMEVTGTQESGPQKIGTPAGDLLAGQDAALSCVAALFHARSTGEGHYIDIAMVESMTRFAIPRATVYLGSGEVPQRTGATDSVVAIYQTFRTRDSMITLALNSDPVWHRFWEVVGDKDYGAEERFKDNAGRRASRSEIVEKIQQLLLTKTKAEWLKLFNASAVPAGPILTVKETTEDEALLARGMFFATEAGGSRIPQVGLGIHVDGVDAGFRSPPPDLGQDTEAVLRALLGYDEARLDALRVSSAIP
jgi:crotonobetainyl-CoA:carnitine CoA-transferase CaiB-like acyl-CoA transferase